MELTTILILLVAFILDLIIGDPRKLPHLIVGFGNLIAFGEKRLNKNGCKFIKGMLLTIVLVSSAFLVPFFMNHLLLENDFDVVYVVVSIILLFYCLANRTLINEGLAVFNTLENEGIEAGRKRLSWIVGRDTSKLNIQQIRMATLETMSENLSDGIIAPLFYFMLFGVPGAMLYKMINTLDSMIGYKNERYEKFGKFAARLDDVANFIPARITAVLMLLVKLKIQGLKFVLQESKKHTSPNAGYPEAALAYLLNCQLGGPNYYQGKLVAKPFIGFNKREIPHNDIKKVVFINLASSVLFCVLFIVFFYATKY